MIVAVAAPSVAASPTAASVPGSDRGAMLMTSFGALEAIEKIIVSNDLTTCPEPLVADLLILLRELFFAAPTAAGEAVSNNRRLIQQLFTVIGDHRCFIQVGQTEHGAPVSASSYAQVLLEDIVTLKEGTVDLRAITNFNQIVPYMCPWRFSTFCRLLVVFLCETEDKTASSIFDETALIFCQGNDYKFPHTLDEVETLRQNFDSDGCSGRTSAVEQSDVSSSSSNSDRSDDDDEEGGGGGEFEIGETDNEENSGVIT
eukprot:Selendium_serpulae@DN9110_c0_g1_i1.p1